MTNPLVYVAFFSACYLPMRPFISAFLSLLVLQTTSCGLNSSGVNVQKNKVRSQYTIAHSSIHSSRTWYIEVTMPGGLKDQKIKHQRCRKNRTWIQLTETPLPCSCSSLTPPGRSLSSQTPTHRELSPFCFPRASIIICLISDTLGMEPFKGFKPKHLNIHKSR